MLNSSAVGDSGKVSVRRSAYSQTFALLGQYMKERKGFGDLSFQMARHIDGRGSNNTFHHATMNLFPMNERAEDVPTSRNGKSNVLPQHSDFTALKPNSSEIHSAPMTIFYAGQVIVFNDFPSHKVKEIMELASRGISQNLNTTTPVVASNDDNNVKNSHLVKKSMVDTTTSVPPPSLNMQVFPTSSGTKHQIQEPALKPRPPVTNDLPIARKASLHRFLEKRKDRITAKAPYNTSKPGDKPSKSQPNDINSWLGLAAAGLPSPQT